MSCFSGLSAMYTKISNEVKIQLFYVHHIATFPFESVLALRVLQQSPCCGLHPLYQALCNVYGKLTFGYKIQMITTVTFGKLIMTGTQKYLPGSNSTSPLHCLPMCNRAYQKLLHVGYDTLLQMPNYQ